MKATTDEELALYYACVDNKYQHLHRWKGSIIGYYYFFNYIPKSASEEVSPSSELVRKLVWKFKDGVYQNDYVENIVIKKLKSVFSFMPEMFTFVCIPASTEEKTSNRYMYFSRQVCKETKMANGYDYVRITKEGPAKHIEGEGGCEYDCDGEFFKDRNVIVFDDVLTRGHSLEKMVEKLEKVGARVYAAFFLGRTTINSLNHPWIIDEDNSNREIDQDYLDNLDKKDK